MIEVMFESDEIEAAHGRLAARCCAAAAAIGPKLDREVALLIADDETLHAMNIQFRAIDKPTNVLAFPTDDADFLGDIALSVETAIREAAEKGVSLEDHAAHLIIHGMLHLIGYDHEDDVEAVRMERRETEILASLGVADPYQEPAT